MARIVQKFGGTSVADIDRIKAAAQRVKRAVDAGDEVAVVVSAMSGTTNQLVEWTRAVSPMHDARAYFACWAVAGCVIVAGGYARKSAEVYDEELNRWLRLPCDLPYVGGLHGMGSAVL